MFSYTLSEVKIITFDKNCNLAVLKTSKKFIKPILFTKKVSLGFVKLSDDQLESLTDPRKAITADLPTIEDAVDDVAWLCGHPDLIVEQLMDIQERYPGLNQVNIGNSVGMPQSVIVEQLEWFAQDVMPAFKK